MITYLAGLHDGPYWASLRWHIETLRGRMPAELLPIGHDPGGNLICLAYRGEQRGTIYYWDHEMEAEEGEPATWDNLYPLAKSFTEFLNGLTSAPE